MLMAAGLLAFTASAPAAGNGNPGVLPPQSAPYGATYGEWAQVVGMDAVVSGHG